MSAVDSITGLRLGGTLYNEDTQYSIGEGPLESLINKGRDYLTSLVPSGLNLQPLGMAIQAKGDRLIMDSSWQLNASLPSLPFPVSGTLKIRISALGEPSVQTKNPAIAKNYKAIREYATGISFDSSFDTLDSSLVTTYRNRGNQKYVLSNLKNKSFSELVNVSKVTASTPQGTLAGFLAGAIKLSNTPTVDLNTSPFGADFAAGWPTTDWIA